MPKSNYSAQIQRQETIVRLAISHFVAAFFSLLDFWPLWKGHLIDPLCFCYFDFNNVHRSVYPPVLLIFALALLFFFALVTGVGLLRKSDWALRMSRIMPEMTIPLWIVLLWNFAKFIGGEGGTDPSLNVMPMRCLVIAFLILVPCWFVVRTIYRNALASVHLPEKRKLGISSYLRLLGLGVALLLSLINFRAADGRRLIHDTASYGWTPVIAALLHLGQDIDVRDYRERTPLHFAAQQGRVCALNYLLDKGADINAQDKEGNTPIMTANNYWDGKESDGYRAIITLVERHADLNRRNNYHDCFQIYCSENFYPTKLVHLLAERGELQDSRTLYDLMAYAAKYKSPQEVDYLLAHGGKVHPEMRKLLQKRQRERYSTP